MNAVLPDLAAEWLESDGLGGFASGTVGGCFNQFGFTGYQHLLSF